MTTRTNQRARTRRALLDAASELLDRGCATPTMDEIAEQAGVSRATAYRYFESAPDVVWQVVVDRQLQPAETAFDDLGDNVAARIERAEAIVNGYLFGDPDGTRAFERAMLDRQLTGVVTPDDRAGRRLHYIDAALEPIADRLAPAELERVRYALALTMGSQVVSALLDTCGLDVDDARNVTGFASQVIISEALRAAGLEHSRS